MLFLEELVEKITRNANACLESLLADLDALEPTSEFVTPQRKRKSGARDSNAPVKKRRTQIEPKARQLAKSFLNDQAEGKKIKC